MHGADDEMAGLGRGDGHLDGLQVAELADVDDVGVLAEGALEGAGERLRVLADFALGDIATLGRLHDLDGILHGDDVIGARLVEIVDHRGERGGLAGADGAGDEDQAVVVGEEFLDCRQVGRETEVAERRHLVRHHAVGTRGAALVEHPVHAVPVGAAEGEGVVVVLALEEDLFLAVGEQRGVQAERIFSGEDIVRQEVEGPALADKGPRPGGKVEVAGGEVRGLTEQAAKGRGESLVVQDADGFEGELGRRPGPAFFDVHLDLGGSGGLGERRLGAVVGERVAERRGLLALVHGQARDFFEGVDVLDITLVDEPLGKSSDIRVIPDRGADGVGVLASEKALVNAEADQPENVVGHAGKVVGMEEVRQRPADKPSAKD